MPAKRALTLAQGVCGEPFAGEGWLGNLDSNQDRRSQSPLFYH